jgi:hypothetical protein
MLDSSGFKPADYQRLVLRAHNIYSGKKDLESNSEHIASLLNTKPIEDVKLNSYKLFYSRASSSSLPQMTTESTADSIERLLSQITQLVTDATTPQEGNCGISYIPGIDTIESQEPDITDDLQVSEMDTSCQLCCVS